MPDKFIIRSTRRFDWRFRQIKESLNRFVLTFAAMHRLSELSRYAPDKLAKHFDCQHNWLLSEFIVSAPNQFIDSVLSKITGHDFFTLARL